MWECVICVCVCVCVCNFDMGRVYLGKGVYSGLESTDSSHPLNHIQ